MAIAAVDWVAVGRGFRRAEAVLKPLVPLPLIAVALAVHAWWFAAALALCLAGDVLLLCSDGLTSMISEDTMTEVLRTTSSLDEAARVLIERANAAGGRDNITIAVVDLDPA